MAGSRGPIGKRSDEKLGHHAAVDVTKAPAGPAIDPGPADECWADIAKQTWEAMRISGQVIFYEATDWAMARYMCEAMSRNLHQGGQMSSVMFAAVNTAAQNLLLTEGDRRRMKLELQRGRTVDPDHEASIHAVADYRRAVGVDPS